MLQFLPPPTVALRANSLVVANVDKMRQHMRRLKSDEFSCYSAGTTPSCCLGAEILITSSQEADGERLPVPVCTVTSMEDRQTGSLLLLALALSFGYYTLWTLVMVSYLFASL